MIKINDHFNIYSTIMTDKNTKYLTVKEAAELTGKSESTIKRIVHGSKRNSKHFMFEKLPTGREKIFVSKTFLDIHFNGQKTTFKQRSNDRYIDSPDHDIVEILKGVIAEKDKQIESLLENQRDYLERQKESNVLLLGNKQMLQLEEKPKRWWQRK